MIGKIIGALIQHRATVENISSSLSAALLGVPFPGGNSPRARRDLVEALLQDNGDGIRIAHGECDGDVGMLAAVSGRGMAR